MNKDRNAFVLDACALIAFLNAEEGWKKVGMLLDHAATGSSSVFMHSINLCEVSYDCLRAAGPSAMKSLLETVKKLPVTIVTDVPEKMMIEAAQVKSRHKMSLADAFVLGFAKINGTKVVTCDHGEFDPVDKLKYVDFHWIR